MSTLRRIACLHTAESNVAVFDAALQSSGLVGWALRHVVRSDLLAAAEAAGGLEPAIAAQTVAALRDLGDGAHAVLLTCSTLGPAAEEANALQARAGLAAPILRVDAALAAEAVRGGGQVVVLCAVETTLEPTRRLFEAATATAGPLNPATVRVALVPGAWAAFKAGDRARYHALIACAAEEALRAGADRVALAQASMAGASMARASMAGASMAGASTRMSSHLPLDRAPILESPTIGLLAATQGRLHPTEPDQ